MGGSAPTSPGNSESHICHLSLPLRRSSAQSQVTSLFPPEGERACLCLRHRRLARLPSPGAGLTLALGGTHAQRQHNSVAGAPARAQPYPCGEQASPDPTRGLGAELPQPLHWLGLVPPSSQPGVCREATTC